MLQVLSFVAENEREIIRKRQVEGIRIAKSKVIIFGRPSVPEPNIFSEIVLLLKSRQITSEEAIKMSGLTRGTFYRKLALEKIKNTHFVNV